MARASSISEGAATDRLVLVVRPEPGASETVAALAARGVPALACPPSRIVPADPVPTVPAGTDAVVLTSANAARVMGRGLAGLPAWCVGVRTAEAAEAAGCDPVISAGGDALALASLLSHETPLGLFHPRGADLAVDLREVLGLAGHTIEERIVYAAEPLDRLAPTAVAALAAGRVAIAAFWSPRGARLLLEALAQEDPTARAGLDTARLVALSPAVAEALALTGRKVATAALPDGLAMQDLIVSQWC